MGEKKGVPRYKTVKDRMKHAFRDIREDLERGRAPGDKSCREFLADARLMASYPGKGEEHYPRFLSALDAFEAAVNAGDAAAMAAGAAALRAMKKDCHARYKK